MDSALLCAHGGHRIINLPDSRKQAGHNCRGGALPRYPFTQPLTKTNSDGSSEIQTVWVFLSLFLCICSNSCMSAQSSGSRRSPCTDATPTARPALTAAWPGTRTVPGMDSAALGSTPLAKGMQENRIFTLLMTES